MGMQSTTSHDGGIDRRRFLERLGSGAIAVWMAGTTCDGLAAGGQTDTTLPGHFGRMFHLPPFAPQTDTVREALLALGEPGGIMDAQDDLAAGPVALIVDPLLNLVNRNHPKHSAGLTFLGQFLDHDMTFDLTSRLGFPTQPVRSPNARTPCFDLDSVYAGGPGATPELYDPADPGKLRVEFGGLFEDVPRNPATFVAIIGDPRNDENLMIAGLHAACLLFHNRAVDEVRAQNAALSDTAVFLLARRLTTWHYQWIILHEFLPSIVDQAIVNTVLSNGRRFYNPRRDQAFIPVEFQIAYRFGHSMVRPSYRANLKGDHGQPFFGMIFDPAGEGSVDPVDLRGGARASRRFVGWQTFFDFGGPLSGDVRPHKRIDTKISTPLFRLPLGAIASGTPPTSLMQRNLLRCLTWQLPSGQAIAERMGLPPLAAADLAELQPILPAFVGSTPLFYYILKEAEVIENGARLGPVGGRMVAEVVIGLLQTDPTSYVTVQPTWVPTLPTRAGTPQGFRMTDFLTFARVDPASRGQ
jgi:Animal haem peroxidase